MRTVVVLLMLAAAASAIERKDAELASTLLTMKRVYVDRFTGGETAEQLRDMVISSLQGTRLFQITENEERADVTLRGSGEDLVFTEEHSSSDNLSIHANGSGSQSEAGIGSSSRSSGISGGQNESSRSSERKHEATASVRLVNRDGDVIWSATKESFGGKFRGASGDVADKLARQLVQDVEKARGSAARQGGSMGR